MRHTHRYSVPSYKYIRDIQMSSQPSNAASLGPATETHCDLLEVHQPEPGKVSRTSAPLIQVICYSECADLIKRAILSL